MSTPDGWSIAMTAAMAIALVPVARMCWTWLGRWPARCLLGGSGALVLRIVDSQTGQHIQAAADSLRQLIQAAQLPGPLPTIISILANLLIVATLLAALFGVATIIERSWATSARVRRQAADAAEREGVHTPTVVARDQHTGPGPTKPSLDHDNGEQRS